MMKFVLRNCMLDVGCRIGVLSTEINGHEHHLETPLCLLYTRGGNVPYLTRDMLDRIPNTPVVAQMPLTLLAGHKDIIDKYQQGIGKLTGMEDFLIYCTMQDSMQNDPAGYNDVAGVSIWGRGGKIKVNEEEYMKLLSTLQPHWYQALCDSDTNAASSRKRVKRSVDRTLDYLDRCIQIASDIPTLRDSQIFGVIEGGYLVEERLRSAEATAKRLVAGFSIEGFHHFGPEAESCSLEGIQDILTQTLTKLPIDKPRHLPGLWSPLDILRAVRSGVDIFDSTLIYAATARSSAFVFRCDISGKEDEVSEPSSQDAGMYEINLNEKIYFDDARPIMQGCSCYTCTNHTRAYIHHLVVTSELLAGVLLMMHNCHHYFSFFSAIRESIRSKQFDVFEQIMINRLSMTNKSEHKNTYLSNTISAINGAS